MAKKSGLGKGLDALFEDNNNESAGGVLTLRISEVEPNKNQPRQNFDEESIANLAESIRENGLIQPIVVRKSAMGYQIIAGERRWRACRMLGMNEITAVVKEYDDEQVAKAALIENIQRENLNPIEEAAAYKDLMEKYDMTQEQLSKVIGKSRSSIANSVRMLEMPESIQQLLISGKLSIGQAKAIASAKDEETMEMIARQASDGKLTVRGIEKLIAKFEEDEAETSAEQFEVPDENSRKVRNYCTEMEIALRERLGRKIKITPSADGNGGKIVIDYLGMDDLTSIAQKLTSDTEDENEE
ncbi:MAG: ParB/RepB/Spo0J family partition protein [Oscillospiraceae bacterium]